MIRESGKADREGDKMASSMEKKLTELEMGLLHLQQNIDIPEITLTVHPGSTTYPTFLPHCVFGKKIINLPEVQINSLKKI